MPTIMLDILLSCLQSQSFVMFIMFQAALSTKMQILTAGHCILIPRSILKTNHSSLRQIIRLLLTISCIMIQVLPTCLLNIRLPNPSRNIPILEHLQAQDSIQPKLNTRIPKQILRQEMFKTFSHMTVLLEHRILHRKLRTANLEPHLS